MLMGKKELITTGPVRELMLLMVLVMGHFISNIAPRYRAIYQKRSENRIAFN